MQSPRNRKTLELLHSSVQGDELMHHGVLGQKWGIRRYQPYGEGGYDPENAGRFVGNISKKDQKKLFKQLKKVNRWGMYNPTSKTRNKLLNDKDLRNAVLSNKKLMKAVHDNNTAYDNYMKKQYEHRSGLLSDKDLEKAYDRWTTTSGEKKKELETLAKTLLGDYSDKVVEKLYGEESHRRGKHVLYGILDQVASRTDRGLQILPNKQQI